MAEDDFDIEKELKDAAKIAESETIDNALLNEVINDLLMIEEPVLKKRRDNILQIIERRKDLNEI
tara:strand:+ start:282 stop:476 length:195 start_codon:yes stop_codon:yes gene_type:complete